MLHNVTIIIVSLILLTELDAADAHNDASDYNDDEDLDCEEMELDSTTSCTASKHAQLSKYKVRCHYTIIVEHVERPASEATVVENDVTTDEQPVPADDDKAMSSVDNDSKLAEEVHSDIIFTSDEGANNYYNGLVFNLSQFQLKRSLGFY